jgi:hypothetical protein
LRAVVEQLGAVTALKQEGLAGGNVGKLRAEPVDLKNSY